MSVNFILAIVYTSESITFLFTTAYPFNSPVPTVVCPKFKLDNISLDFINPTILNSCFFNVSVPFTAFSINSILSPILYFLCMRH